MSGTSIQIPLSSLESSKHKFIEGTYSLKENEKMDVFNYFEQICEKNDMVLERFDSRARFKSSNILGKTS